MSMREMPPARGVNPEFDAMVDATLRALDMPGGEEILERMINGHMPVGDGLVSLALLSGDYERRNLA